MMSPLNSKQRREYVSHVMFLTFYSWKRLVVQIDQTATNFSKNICHIVFVDGFWWLCFFLLQFWSVFFHLVSMSRKPQVWTLDLCQALATSQHQTASGWCASRVLRSWYPGHRTVYRKMIYNSYVLLGINYSNLFNSSRIWVDLDRYRTPSIQKSWCIHPSFTQNHPAVDTEYGRSVGSNAVTTIIVL